MSSRNSNLEPSVTLVLPLSQINVVLKGLGELPLKESRIAAANIEQQASADIQRQREFLVASGESASALAPKPAEMPAQAAEPQ